MRYIVTLSVIFLLSMPVFSQQDMALTSTFYAATTPVPATAPSEIAWVAPVFPGGQARMMTLISDGITYPELAQENNIEGFVVVRLSLTASGMITKVETLRSLGFGCDEVVLKQVAKLPAFKPALHYGEVVESSVVIPVRFRLR